MANIRKRGNKYQVQIRRDGYPSLYKSFSKKSDAETWARHNESLADRGDIPQPSRLLKGHTVQSVFERYKAEVSIKKRSYNSEKFILDALIRQSFSSKTLDNILVSDFLSYREERLKEVKAGTVNRELAIAKHAFDIAIKEWNIPLRENPLSKIKKLKVNNARTRRLHDDEWQSILDAINKTRNKHIIRLIRFAMFTGMRRGELLRLKWQDIDESLNVLFIPVTKNGYSRTIPLSLDALSVLAEIEKEESGLIFPLTANSVRMAWDRLVKRAGVKDLHFHDLRHEAISRFFEKGLSVPEVALISGHRDFRMLFRYTHLKAEDIAKKINN